MKKVQIELRKFLEELHSVDRDAVAAVLSVLPGAGHLYKRHYIAGLGILIGGNLLIIFIALLLGLATLGTSLVVVPALYWAMVGFTAYSIPDWHGRHYALLPWGPTLRSAMGR